MRHRPRLLTSAELSAWGYAPRDRRVEPAASLLIPLRAGVFAVREEWEAAKPEERIVTRAEALARVSAEPPLFSHETAAAIHGLPLYAPDQKRVHATVPESRPGAARGVIRHRGTVAPDDVVRIDGLHCTSLVRTVSDIARTAPVEQAVAVADAALRSRFTHGHAHYDEAGAREFVTVVAATAELSAHGSRRATRIVAFADGRAHRPGESVSRIRLAQLGFRPPRLQVAVPAPRPGRSYFVDFGMDEVAALGEFDGRIKYEDGRLLMDRTADEVFQSEKEREDWIRGVTGRTLVRWGWSHLVSPATLGARLRAFNVTPSGPAVRGA
ncbi:UNVERIFIED_CONTAM: hypothetical protein OHV15_13210 [Microbacterium sp. SLM126]